MSHWTSLQPSHTWPYSAPFFHHEAIISACICAFSAVMRLQKVTLISFAWNAGMDDQSAGQVVHSHNNWPEQIHHNSTNSYVVSNEPNGQIKWHTRLPTRAVPLMQCGASHSARRASNRHHQISGVEDTVMPETKNVEWFHTNWICLHCLKQS